MNNPLGRKMFRQAGMSKQPMGILTSSPELMSAAKGYNVGGAVGSTGGLNQIYDTSKLNIFRRPGDTIGVEENVINKDKDNIGQLGFSKIGDRLSDLKNKDLEIDTSLEAKPDINESNKNILENQNLKFPEGSNLGLRGKEDDKDINIDKKEPTKSNISADTLYGGVSSKIDEQAKMIGVAYDNLNKDTASLKEKKFLGTTYNKESAKLMKLLKEEGKEFTIADAKKVATQMGFASPDELDDQYSEDKEAAFWLNMMKAGAAMAAGESSNTLTNFAKGFTVGLEGYGKDTGELRKELREDKKEASKTIYNLLKDGRSEAIAKRALEIQKASALTNIIKTEVGDERERLTNEVNNEVANRKLTISLYKTFADMNFEAMKFNVSRDDLNKSIEMAYAKMMPDDLKILQAAGQITVIDPNKPLTPDNIKATPEGEKNIENLLTKNLSGKITDGRYKQGTAGDRGFTSSGIVLNWKGNEKYNKRESGDAIVAYNKQRAENIKAAGGQETPYVASQDVQFAKVNGGKIDFEKQTKRMQDYFTDRKKGPSLLDQNQGLFINYKPK